MANKVKAQNAYIRREMAADIAKHLRKQHPDWTDQEINAAAYKAADRQIKRGEVRVS